MKKKTKKKTGKKKIQFEEVSLLLNLHIYKHYKKVAQACDLTIGQLVALICALDMYRRRLPGQDGE